MPLASEGNFPYILWQTIPCFTYPQAVFQYLCNFCKVQRTFIYLMRLLQIYLNVTPLVCFSEQNPLSVIFTFFFMIKKNSSYYSCNQIKKIYFILMEAIICPHFAKLILTRIFIYNFCIWLEKANSGLLRLLYKSNTIKFYMIVKNTFSDIGPHEVHSPLCLVLNGN